MTRFALACLFVAVPALAADLKVTGVSPHYAPVDTGALITISGEGFAAPATAWVDDGFCTDVKVVSDTRILCFAAAHAKGWTDVLVAVGSETSKLQHALLYFDPLKAVPIQYTLEPGFATDLTVTGGVPPYQFALGSGAAGTVDCHSGRFVAPETEGDTKVVVKDAAGNTVEVALHVNRAMAVSSDCGPSVQRNANCYILARGGVGEPSYSIVRGGGWLEGGKYFAPQFAGRVTLRATDALGVYKDVEFEITGPGSQDPRFGTAGIASAQFASPGEASLVRTDSWGRILVLKTDRSGHADHDFELVRFDPFGILDSTFGNGGRLVGDLVEAEPGKNPPVGMLILKDHEIVVAGNGPRSIILMKYSLNGGLVRHFGTDGRASRRFAMYETPSLFAMYAQGDRLLTVGYGDARRLDLARFHAKSGKPDLSYGFLGIAKVGLPARFESSTIDSQGRVVIASVWQGSNWADRIFFLSRITHGGTTDLTFGRLGSVRVPDVKWTHWSDGSHAEKVLCHQPQVAAQPDGKVLLETYCEQVGNIVLRFKETGGIDRKFGEPRETYNQSGFDFATLASSYSVDSIKMTTDPAGRILAASAPVSWAEKAGSFELNRLTRDGKRDKEFNFRPHDGYPSSGIMTGSFAGKGCAASVSAIELQTDSWDEGDTRILVAGNVSCGADDLNHGALASIFAGDPRLDRR